jgi:hypothetical protein
MNYSRNLAVMGGSPAFETLLHVGRPNVGDRERLMAYVRRTCFSEWLPNRGPLMREFEGRLQTLAACTDTAVGLRERAFAP